MAENGYITQAQMAEAVAAPVRIYHDENLSQKYAPYMVEHVRRYLLDKYGEDALYKGGLKVTLPSSLPALKAARRALVKGLEEVDKRVGYRGPLRQLKSSEEIEKFLRQERGDLILKKLEFELLMPDGRLDLLEAMKSLNLQSEVALLDPQEKYEAVVTDVDDGRKIAGVILGGIKAEIPWEKMRWARPAADEKNPMAFKPEPKAPSKILKKGDVVLVKLVENSSKGVLVSLEQEAQVQGALFSLDVRTGEVLAMEGGYNFEKSEFNRAIQAMRQPGSSFKPIIYAAGLEKGYTPASIIVDSPIVYNDGDSGKWKPSNFEERFYGDTTFRQALIKSRNVPTIKIVQALQVPFVIEYAKRLGLTGQFNADLSISLGSGATDLMSLTKTYALFPRLGRKVSPIFISSVKDRAGQMLEETKSDSQLPVPRSPVVNKGLQNAPGAAPTPTSAVSANAQVVFPDYPLVEDPDQVLDPRVAYVMTHLMKEVVTYGTGHAAQELGRPAAGKTGTTNEYIDAWFMGFTQHVVTGVWVGFDNHRSIGPSETGAKAALPIWLEYMQEAVKAYPNEDFQVPPGIVFASINSVTGKPVSPNSSSAIREAFIEGTQPVREASEKPSAASETPSDFFKEDSE
jgi:penicillin-binding protein 1A